MIGRIPMEGGLSRLLLRTFIFWLPAALVITGLSGLTYVTAQQTLRMSANNPQVQMAEDAATQLEAGEKPEAIVGSGKVDMAKSLAPFLIVYDASGRQVASSAVLDGQAPTLPEGILAYVRASGEDRLTWQPREGVRDASIVTAASEGRVGFVLAGRSLREVENQISNIGLLVGAGCAATLAGSFILLGLVLAIGDKLFARSEIP